MPAKQHFSAPLIEGITVERGYRPQFVKFVKKHFLSPRPYAHDEIFEWVRGNVMTDRDFPGCCCMQNFLYRLDMKGAWKRMLEDRKSRGYGIIAEDFEESTYGGSPSPARNFGEKDVPPEGKPAKKTPPVKPSPKGAPVKLPSLSPGDPILNAVKELVQARDNGSTRLFTKSGKPYVSAIENILGYDISSKDRDKAWSAYLTLPKLNPPSFPAKENGKFSEPDLINEIAAERKLFGRNRVKTALRESSLWRMTPKFVGDGALTALPMSTWMKILEWSDIDRIKYVVDQRTCSNFAVGFAGQVSMRLGVDGIGLVADFGGGHAYNCLLVCNAEGKTDLRVVLMEPQTDRLPQIGGSLSGSESYTGKGEIIFF